ncbi:taurine ABC transporter substrate-binding protein [Agrobacterium vitis]|uniref:ABC transporter substrate-binding protein n=1 Tax=Allorhizobium ampelinum TaxID=3025782 RepID=UPI001F3D78B6|nr:ABC transporter substrate-binding protein [Allorhizobium ampelinum]MCF1449898.1 taurine ABC transporter substrate-binding protein [Allorhizobium ampelinum]
MSDQKTELSIALAAFDRHIPFFMGWLPEAERFRLKALDVGINPPGRDGGDRHGRMLRDREFDIAEVSLSSYLMARAKGARFTAVPVFPRRLFSQNHIFVHHRSGIEKPADLAGKRVAIRAFQVTLSVLAKGDLASEYGVPWRSIRWVVQENEQIEWDGTGASIETMPKGTTGAELVKAGLVDAYIDPRPPATILADSNVRPLFADRQAECADYYWRRSAFPIMHLLAIRQETADAFPELPAYLISAWEDAKIKARRFYEDPAYTLMPFGRAAYETAIEDYGRDPWPSGIAANAENLRWFQEYMVDQTLLVRPLADDALFHPSVLDT